MMMTICPHIQLKLMLTKGGNPYPGVRPPRAILGVKLINVSDDMCVLTFYCCCLLLSPLFYFLLHYSSLLHFTLIFVFCLSPLIFFISFSLLTTPFFFSPLLYLYHIYTLLSLYHLSSLLSSPLFSSPHLSTLLVTTPFFFSPLSLSHTHSGCIR
jgi:hypothetical protein